MTFKYIVSHNKLFSKYVYKEQTRKCARKLYKTIQCQERWADHSKANTNIFYLLFCLHKLKRLSGQGHTPHKWQSQSPNSSWWQKVSLMSLMAFAFHTSWYGLGNYDIRVLGELYSARPGTYLNSQQQSSESNMGDNSNWLFCHCHHHDHQLL